MSRNRKIARRPVPARAAAAAQIEAVEPRTMMSAAAPATVSPDAVYLRSATAAFTTTASPVSGSYTPAQIRTAYGFDSATFSNGSVAAKGAGQTIALIDAYNDPNIRADLGVFDAQFGLAAPGSFDVVNQTGGTNLPTTDASWAGEIALDVEWAHAIAPAASILLVEASSDNTPDLLAAVNYARSAAGVSVVSMSWGGSEFESSYNGGESSAQTTYDADFTTPANHRGVTFVAAAGDSGQQAGVQWPASSPNVLSVGGTTLTTAADGTYVAEAGWSGTSSGYSQVEPEPAYQQAAQTTGSRSVSDVAYDADPNTGFAVYDSVAADGASGWQEVGGTSAGSPQWGALVAIANQGRSIAGLASLDGVTQTLPDLYGLYASYGTADDTGYAGAFNDVTSGGSGSYGGFRHAPRGDSANNARPGYDLVTGLGTPKAASIIDDLATSAAVTGGSGSTTGTGGTGSGGTTTSSVALSPVAVALLNAPPSAVVGGTAATLTVRLSNTAGTSFNGPITVTLYTSTDGTAANEDATLTTVPLKNVKLKAGASRTLKVRFNYPTDLTTGTYYVVASADATATDTQATTAATAAVTIAAPTVDLSVAFAGSTAVAVTPGKKDKATVRIANLGNVTAKGTVAVTLTAVSAADGSSLALASVPRVLKVKMAAGKVMSLSLAFTAPTDVAAGEYTLIATITSATTPADGNRANDTATIATDAA